MVTGGVRTLLIKDLGHIPSGPEAKGRRSDEVSGLLCDAAMRVSWHAPEADQSGCRSRTI